jgi:ribonuclease G
MSMRSPYRIFINETLHERRIAFCTNKRVEEVWIDRGGTAQDYDDYIVGNIYQGVVERKLPGMEAAFVDIGHERNGFLYGGDLADDNNNRDDLEYLDDDNEKLNYTPPSFKSLKPNEKIMVQVTKGPIAAKGARLTVDFSLPGKFLVLMPTHSRVGVSRKIQDPKKRKQFYDAIRSARKEGLGNYGVIIRTAALMINTQKIQAEYLRLCALWNDILENRQTASKPTLLYSDRNVIDRLMREYCTSKTKMIVDSPSLFKDITQKATDQYFFPTKNIMLFDKKGPLFDHFGIESAVQKALDRRVWLKSGGYLVFDQTEALTVIDVNTGRFVGRKQLEETLVKNNMEAAEEIVHQVILRNISGIIIIDFIDMDEEKHRTQLLDVIKKLFREDRVKNAVLTMTQLGLVQITRRRTYKPLADQLCVPCFYCEGKGFLKSQESVFLEIMRQIALRKQSRRWKKFKIRVNDNLKKTIQEKYKKILKTHTTKTGIQVSWEGHADFHQEEFEVIKN